MKLVERDDELLAILAHEAGHHEHRHGMRRALASSAVVVVAGFLFGDLSGTASLSVSIFGDQDMTVMRAHFVKPNTAVAMSFSDDPQMGIVCEKFTGSAVTTLSTTSFVMRTASLR